MFRGFEAILLQCFCKKAPRQSPVHTHTLIYTLPDVFPFLFHREYKRANVRLIGNVVPVFPLIEVFPEGGLCQWPQALTRLSTGAHTQGITTPLQEMEYVTRVFNTHFETWKTK